MRSAFDDARRWPDGHRELTLFALPERGRVAERGDGSRLATLVDGVREVVSGFPATRMPVPDAGLHMTVQAINHGLYDEPPIGKSTVAKLVEALTILLGDRHGFSLWMGSPMIGDTGVVLDYEPLDLGPAGAIPADPFGDLVTDVRDVIARLCGTGAIGHDSRPGHMALFYAGCDQDTVDFGSALRRRARPSHAWILFRTLVLGWIRQNPAACCYDWDVVKRFHLPEPGAEPGTRMVAVGGVADGLSAPVFLPAASRLHTNEATA